MDTTYTFHFHFSEETAGHHHAQGNGEDEDEGKCEGHWTGLHEPQNGKTHYLDGCEQVHSSCAHLCPRYTHISHAGINASPYMHGLQSMNPAEQW